MLALLLVVAAEVLQHRAEPPAGGAQPDAAAKVDGAQGDKPAGDAPGDKTEESGEEKADEPKEEALRSLRDDLMVTLEAEMAHVTKEVEGQFENGNAELAEKTTEMSRQVEKVEEASSKSANAIFQQLQMVDKGLQSKMEAARKAEEQQNEEQKRKQDEVVSLAQQTQQSFKGQQRTLDTSLNNVESLATRLPVDIQEAKNSATKATEDTATNVANMAKRDAEQATADVEKRIHALEQDLDSESKDAKTQLAAAVTDIGAMREQAEKTMGARVDKVAADVQQAQTSVATVGQKLDNAIQELAGLSRKQDAALESATGSLETKFQDVTETVKLVKETATKQMKNTVGDGVAELKKMDQARYTEAKATMVQRFDEAKQDAQRKVKQVNDAVANVKSEHERLAEQIKSVSAKADETRALIDTTEEKVQKTQKEMDEKAATLHKDNAAKIEKLDEQVKGDLKKQAEQITAKIEEAGREQKAALKTATDEIHARVKELETQLDQQSLVETHVSQRSATAAGALLQGIQHVAADLRQEKDEVNAHLPQATEALTKAYAAVGSKVDRVKRQLADGKDEVLQVLAQSSASIDAATQASLRKSEQRMQQQLDQQSGVVNTALGSLVEQVAALQEGSAKDYALARAKQDDLEDALQRAAQRAADVRQRTEDQGAELKGKIQAAVDILKHGDTQAVQDSEALERSLQQLVHDQTKEATRRAGQAIAHKMQQQNQELTGFERKAAAEIQADASLLQTYAKESDAKVSAMQGRVQKLAQGVQRTELAAAGKHRDLLQQAQSLADQQRQLEQKQHAQLGAARQMIDQRSGELASLVEEKVAAVQAADHEQIEALRRQAKASLLAEQARQETEKNKVDRTLQRWQDGLGAEIASVGAKVQESRRGLAAYADDQQRQQQRFAQSVADLDAQIHSGEERVDAQIQKEDEEVRRVMKGQLGTISGLVEKFHGAQGDTEKKMAELKAAYADQLHFVQDQSAAKGKALEAKVKHVELESKALQERFATDRAATDRRLAQTKQRLSHVAGATQAELHKYEAQLRAAKEQREQAQQHADARIDTIEHSLAATMDATSAKIEALKRQTSGSFAQASAQQRQLAASLQKQAQERAQKDEKELQAVEEKMAEVAEDQSRMGAWQKSFTHRAQQWRDEVSRRLAQLLPAREPSDIAAQTDLTQDVADLKAALAGGSATSLLEEDASAKAARLEAENTQLRATNAALLTENKHLYEEDSKLDARIAALAKQVEKA